MPDPTDLPPNVILGLKILAGAALMVAAAVVVLVLS